MVSERQKSRPEPPRGPGCGEVGGRPARAPTGSARPRHRRFRTGPRWAQLRRGEVRAARRGDPRRRRRTVTERSEDEPARGPAIRTGPAGPGLRSGEARAARRGDPRRRRRALVERSEDGPAAGRPEKANPYSYRRDKSMYGASIVAGPDPPPATRPPALPGVDRSAGPAGPRVGGGGRVRRRRTEGTKQYGASAVADPVPRRRCWAREPLWLRAAALEVAILVDASSPARGRAPTVLRYDGGVVGGAWRSVAQLARNHAQGDGDSSRLEQPSPRASASSAVVRGRG